MIITSPIIHVAVRTNDREGANTHRAAAEQLSESRSSANVSPTPSLAVEQRAPIAMRFVTGPKVVVGVENPIAASRPQ